MPGILPYIPRPPKGVQNVVYEATDFNLALLEIMQNTF